MNKVRPKKYLGQHFLHDQSIAARIVDSLLPGKNASVLEIGPGTGVLTKFLLQKPVNLTAVEVDSESVDYLKAHYPELNLIQGDFLMLDLPLPGHQHMDIIGNFPYNISSQIFFRILEHRDVVDQVVCMLQKEVADRIASPPGSKTYGILSVLLQTYYDIKYLFKVQPGSFNPSPKVVSAVIRLQRNATATLPCTVPMYFKVVKQGFNNRRKTLRNALKNLNLPAEILALPLLDKRAEQLGVQDFVELTTLIENRRGDTAV